MDSNNKIRCFPFTLCSRVGLWTILRFLMVYFLYIIVVISILFSLMKGIATIPSLPESFVYLKIGYSILLTFTLVLAVCYVWLKTAAKKLEKKQNVKPLQCYLGIRLKVSSFVNKPQASGMSWMEEIFNLVKRSIIGNLKGCKEEEAKNLEDARYMMNNLYDDLFLKENTPAKNEMLYKAVCFTFKANTIRHPADLQGKRRCYVLIGLLSEIKDASTESEYCSTSWGRCFSPLKSMILCKVSCLQCLKSFCTCFLGGSPKLSCSNNTPSSNCLKFFKRFSCCIPSWCRISSVSCSQSWNNFLKCFKRLKLYFTLDYSSKKYSSKSILIMSSLIMYTVIFFIADNVSDLNVLIQFWKLWSSSGEQHIYAIIFSTYSYWPLAFPGTEICMGLVYLSIFYGISTILTIFKNPFKKIICQFKTQIKMKSPVVEENEEMICPSSIIERYDLPIDESSLESPTQCILQFAIYFSTIPLIRILEELQLTDDKITPAYREKLKSMESVLISGFFSIISITMGQVKINSIFQEYNISWMQCGCYFLASLFSTAFYVCSVTIYQVSLLGANFDIAGLSNIDSVNSTSNNIYTDSIFLVLFGIIGLFTCPIISSITCSKEKNLRLPASRFSWLTSIFNQARLPTSQHIIRGYYSIYHNSIMKCPQLINGIADQTGAFTIVFSLLLCFSAQENSRWSTLPLNCTDCSSFNNSVIDIQRYREDNVVYLLPKSTISSDFQNYIIVISVIIPLCGLLSYLFLWAYFSMDNGFFRAVEVDYYFHDDNKIDNDHDLEKKENVGDNIELIEEKDCNMTTHDDPDDRTAEILHVDTEQKSSTDWIQNWIDQEAEEDWYWYLWRTLSSRILNTNVSPSKKYDMTGSWMDLTGDDGQEEDCEDGVAVLAGEEGTLEYSIRMSFPFYWKQNRERFSSHPTLYSCSSD